MSIATVHAISVILYALSWIVDRALGLQKGTSILMMWSKFWVFNAGNGIHEIVVCAYA